MRRPLVIFDVATDPFVISVITGSITGFHHLKNPSTVLEKPAELRKSNNILFEKLIYEVNFFVFFSSTVFLKFETKTWFCVPQLCPR
jgi:hypothetical protein